MMHFLPMPDTYTTKINLCTLVLGNTIGVRTNYRGSETGVITAINVDDPDVGGETTVEYETEDGSDYWCRMSQILFTF